MAQKITDETINEDKEDENLSSEDEVSQMNSEEVADNKIETSKAKLSQSESKMEGINQSKTSQAWESEEKAAPVKTAAESSKAIAEKDDGSIEPFDLKSFFIPRDRDWVLPVFVAITLLIFGYYMVVFMGIVEETCQAQEEIGDTDCDGYVTPPEVSPEEEEVATDEETTDEPSTTQQDEDNSAQVS